MNGLSVVGWDSTGSNVAWESPGGRVENEVEFRVAAKLENLAVLRTLVAAVATFEDLDNVELPTLPQPGDPIETKIGRCIVTSTESMPAGSEYAGKIVCHLP